MKKILVLIILVFAFHTAANAQAVILNGIKIRRRGGQCLFMN